MFPQFGYSAASFSRATALLTRVGTDAQLYDDPEAPNLALLLDSKYEAEKSEGMKRLIALMSQGRDVSNFFPQVVKNVSSPSLEVKKLVYIYLVHYAEKRPDEALLAINSFQKDLSDINPLVRAWSLRAMSGIRVRVVLPLVVMAVNKCARDPSPYVRRCAAHAIPKVFALDREQHLETLEEIIGVLLNDNSPSVVGAVAAAFSVVCPDRLSLLGTRYQKLCELLPDVDEWGQVMVIDILLRYVIGRHGFPRGSVGLYYAKQAKGLVQGDPYLERKGEMIDTLQVGDGLPGVVNSFKKKSIGEDRSSGNAGDGFLAANESWLNSTHKEAQEPEELSRDIQMLLENTLPLLWSRNSAVVMASARVHWLLSRRENVKKIVQPLIFLLRSSPETQYVVLANLSTFVRMAPSLFEAHYEDFFITSADSEQIRLLKLDILCFLATETSIKYILQEFQAYVRSPDRQFAADTVAAIGRCAVRLPTLTTACTNGLLLLAKSGSVVSNDSSNDGREEQESSSRTKSTRYSPAKALRRHKIGDTRSREEAVVTQAVLALRTIVQQRPLENEEVLARLIRGLDSLKVQSARAVVIWMVGEFSTVGTLVPKMIPVVLQYLAGTFTKESDETKLQIINCVTKVVLRSRTSPDVSSKVAVPIFEVVLRLASQDLNYDIRDRARLFQRLLGLQVQSLTARSEEMQGDISDCLLKDSTNVIERSPEQDSVQAALKPESGSAVLLKYAEHILLVSKTAPAVLSLTPDRSSFLPGSMSHIVQHIAPNYSPLPQPLTVDSEDDDLPVSENLHTNPHERDLDSSSRAAYSGTEEEDYSEVSSSRSSSDDHRIEQGNGENYFSDSAASTSDNGISRSRGSNELALNSLNHSKEHRSAHRKRISGDVEPLISLSDTETGILSRAELQNSSDQQPGGGSSTAGYGLISSKELDSWLGTPDVGPEEVGSSSGTTSGYASISVGKVSINPKIYSLLDFTNGGGLDVKYYFERNSSLSSGDQVVVKLLFCNRGSERLAGVKVKEIETSKTPSEPRDAEISSQIASGPEELDVSELDPGSEAEGSLSVRFRHHSNPIKLSIDCNDKSYSVKLVPQIGALMKPVPMNPETFSSSQARITGMHESARRCSLKLKLQPQGGATEDKLLLAARSVAQKVLTNAHISLVSTTISIGDSFLSEHTIQSGGIQGLCLRFSGKTLIDSVLCLVQVAVVEEGVFAANVLQVELLVKVNCENTVFGLTLLQELSKALGSVE
ncbi:hypothetical protein R1flu_002399 [Riccia fluitans]|uniref:AP-3 complex subunit beta C-terminal domain-containing protein n=1 Tax=Riccia fluitans TaxID=41844 RepID=A0ABD1Y700_9MARC